MKATLKTVSLLLVASWLAPGRASSGPFAERASAALETLRLDAGLDPASSARSEEAKALSNRSFDGQEPPPVAQVTVLSPVGFIEDPAAPHKDPGFQPETPPVGPAKPAEEGDPSYHFVGTTPLPGLTIYRAERDKPGEDNGTTRGKAPATLGTYVKKGLFGLGFLSLIAGIFFPPMLIVGAALLGAGAGMALAGKLSPK